MFSRMHPNINFFAHTKLLYYEVRRAGFEGAEAPTPKTDSHYHTVLILKYI